MLSLCYLCRHPKLLLVVHGPEESPESLAFASEPLIGSLVNILSSSANSSADSYDGSGSNRHGSFDLGLDTSKKQPFPNVGSMLQVDYNFIDVEYRYGFSQVFNTLLIISIIFELFASGKSGE